MNQVYVLYIKFNNFYMFAILYKHSMTFDINEKSQVIESLLTGECSVVTKTFQPDFYCLIPPLLKCESEVSRLNFVKYHDNGNLLIIY